MCGITGVMSAWLDPQELQTFQDLMVVNTLRGKYGSGIVAVPNNAKKDIEHVRYEGSGSELAHSADFYDLTKRKRSILLGHCREPTRGSYELDHVHPHVAGHVIGVHNGTVHKIAGKALDAKASDSKILIERIRDFGVKYALEDVDGAYCIVWIDSQAGTLNFVRNPDRPLTFAYVKGHLGTLYWSSEGAALEYVLSRRCKYDDEIILRKLPAYSWVSFRLHPNGAINVLDRQDIRPKSAVVALPAPTSVPSTGTVNSSITHHFTGKLMPTKDLRMLLANGCCMCGEAATMGDYGFKRMRWISEDSFVCSRCDKSELMIQSHNHPVH
jgi:predicted glutamine amidotransferase